MRLALAALVAIAFLSSVPSQARAQYATPQAPAHKPASFYFFEGISYSKMHGELVPRASEVLQLQLGLGYQPANSQWAYELMGRAGGTVGVQDSGASLLGWGVRAKRFFPLSEHFHAYGRAGLTENLLTDSAGSDLVGFGLEYGVGAMASLRVRALGFLFWPLFFTDFGPKVNVSLWADLGGERGNLHINRAPELESRDYRAATASYGIKLGGRF